MFCYCRYLVGLTPLVKDVICRFGLTVNYVNRVLALFLVVLRFRSVNLVSLLVSSCLPWPSRPNRGHRRRSSYKTG